MKNAPRGLAVLGLSLLFAASAAAGPTHPLTSWPALKGGASAPPPSGILFKLAVDADMQGLFITSVDIRFPRLEEVQSKVDADQWQMLTLTGDELNKFPNDVVLVPLAPGNYFGMSSGIMYRWGSTSFVRAMAGGAFEHFTVPPGKVVNMGTLDINLKAGPITKNAAGQDQRGVSGDCNANSTPARKMEVVEAALARPEADERGWRAALEASRDDVLAAGDFGNEYLIKSWPSRVPAPGMAPHSPAGVLFRLNIAADNPGRALRDVTVYFRRADQEKDPGVTNFQKLVIPASTIDKFPNDVVLVPLSTGSYSGVLLELPYERSAKGGSARLFGDFDRFDVLPGKITPLEDADFKFIVKEVATPDGKGASQWHVETANADADILKKAQAENPAAKRVAAAGRRRAVEAALARPEAETLQWREALEAAKAGLAP